MDKKTKIDWREIDTVFLDMDGTLLDTHHDDYFWDEAIPGAYAKKHKLSLEDAKKELAEIYETKRGMLEWADVDYWEKELDMGLWEIRYQTKHLMKLHPHTLRFLKFLKRHRKKIYLATAAPQRDIDFKIGHVKIGKYFDGIFSEHALRKSKEILAFWEHIRKKIKMDKNRTLLADDNENVLRSAKAFGIKWLVFKSKKSSKKPANKSKEFIAVNHFDELIK